jgi:hypothetical protein
LINIIIEVDIFMDIMLVEYVQLKCCLLYFTFEYMYIADGMELISVIKEQGLKKLGCCSI